MTLARASLANELRIACQQVSRRVRFEPSAEIPPHQVSVLGKLMAGPKTPGELAELEQISGGSWLRPADSGIEDIIIPNESGSWENL